MNTLFDSYTAQDITLAYDFDNHSDGHTDNHNDYNYGDHSDFHGDHHQDS